MRASLTSLAASIALGIGLVAAAAVLAATPAHAQKKETIGVLGLEVIEDASGIDAKTTQFAKELTEELRKRPKAGTGPYALAPGSDKDLLEMKLLSGCENEAKECMAAIGQDLATDRLLYGKIEKRSNGYQVSLKLLNVGTRTFERSISDIIPFGEATGANLASWGKKLYAKLTGATEQGTLLVKANVERGTVYVDGQAKGTLSGGQARIAGLGEGRYKVAIEADGHLRYEANVDVAGGGETVHQAELERNLIGGTGGTGPGGGGTITTGTVSLDERPGGGYRALFWTSLAVTAGSGAGVAVFGMRVRGAEEDKHEAIVGWQDATGERLDLVDACGDAERRLAGTNVPEPSRLQVVADKCDAGKRDALLTNVMIGGTVVAGLATVLFYYKGYVQPKASTEAANRVGGRKKPAAPTVTVTPSVGPTHAGAGVRIDF